MQELIPRSQDGSLISDANLNLTNPTPAVFLFHALRKALSWKRIVPSGLPLLTRLWCFVCLFDLVDKYTVYTIYLHHPSHIDKQIEYQHKIFLCFCGCSISKADISQLSFLFFRRIGGCESRARGLGPLA